MADDPDAGLDPQDWPAFRDTAHALLDAAMDKMQAAREGRVWTPFPPGIKAAFDQPLPEAGQDEEALAAQLASLLPYGAGNTHPRFFGWVHGSGTPQNLLAEITASAINANAGGRDHGAIYVERQVIRWCRELFGFPETASGLIVSGTSLATVIALKVARDMRLEFASRKGGLANARLVGYASAEAHACNARAFDILGLGSDALRRIPVNDRFEMDTAALRAAIAADRAVGLQPFVLIGTAGTVNTGATDPLTELTGIAATENLWFHVDGAFGALGTLVPGLAARFAAIARADSLAFDFHKWLHVNYDAGCVLVRDEAHHRHARPCRRQSLAGGIRARTFAWLPGPEGLVPDRRFRHAAPRRGDREELSAGGVSGGEGGGRPPLRTDGARRSQHLLLPLCRGRARRRGARRIERRDRHPSSGARYSGTVHHPPEGGNGHPRQSHESPDADLGP